MFNFYGTAYSGVYLNTNGGMTFGSPNSGCDWDAAGIVQPGIAAFWGDMDASEYGADTRANQMTYEACDNAFIVRYVQFQDNDEATWNNTATVTLSANGTVTIVYGAVLSEDILAGVWNGTHTSDQYPTLQANYPAYPSMGSGVILFDYWGTGPDHAGELSNRTITYTATSPANYRVSVSAPGDLESTSRRGERGVKGEKEFPGVR